MRLSPNPRPCLPASGAAPPRGLWVPGCRGGTCRRVFCQHTSQFPLPAPAPAAGSLCSVPTDPRTRLLSLPSRTSRTPRCGGSPREAGLVPASPPDRRCVGCSSCSPLHMLRLQPCGSPPRLGRSRSPGESGRMRTTTGGYRLGAARSGLAERALPMPIPVSRSLPPTCWAGDGLGHLWEGSGLMWCCGANATGHRPGRAVPSVSLPAGVFLALTSPVGSCSASAGDEGAVVRGEGFARPEAASHLSFSSQFLGTSCCL